MPRSQAPNPERQLMIKTKACQRLIKEVDYYHKEVKENEAKLEDMKSANRDPYDIKKFQEVLDESYMMVPDSKNRLQKSLQDLAAFLDGSDAAAVAPSQWYREAKELLKTVELLHDAENDLKETDLTGIIENEVF
ncbi:unnamed protein product [Cylindrotheca closterium]|uniref:Tubulin-specific chaperone A n=1 Tax=Cylindrotheca closterium TaxID=2856 RepID=A0AAD2FP47_9STRA|nr:unnamed protein product [Cylindrotheca closterium]